MGFRQFGPRTARPGAQPQQGRPWRANSTSGNGERQRDRTPVETKRWSTGTSELAAQIKCVRAQIGQCNDAGRGTESLQNELIRLEKRKASGQSCKANLAVQLKDINLCESNISATSVEIARLRNVWLEKEDELQKLQREKSEAGNAKWELAKANASDLSLDNISSGFVSSVHTRRARSANTEGSQTRASDRLHSIFGVCKAKRYRWIWRRLMKFCDHLEVRRIVAEFKRERDQACAGIADRVSRAMQEAKQKRQKQCGVSAPLPSEEVAQWGARFLASRSDPVRLRAVLQEEDDESCVCQENFVGTSGQVAVVRKLLLCPILSFSWGGSLDVSSRGAVLVPPQNSGKLGLRKRMEGFVLLQCPWFATLHQPAPFFRSRLSLPAPLCAWDLLMGGMPPFVAGPWVRVGLHPSSLAVAPRRGWAPTPPSPAVGPRRGWASTPHRRPWVPGVGGPLPSPALPSPAVCFCLSHWEQSCHSLYSQDFGKRVSMMSLSGVRAPGRITEESQMWPPGFLLALSSVGVVRVSCPMLWRGLRSGGTMVSKIPKRYRKRDHASGGGMGGAGPPICSSCTQFFHQGNEEGSFLCHRHSAPFFGPSSSL